MRNSIRFTATLALFTAIASACGGDGGGPNGDRTPPAVVSVVPADGATGVARTTTITAMFSEPIAGRSLDASSPTSFTVAASGSGAAVAGTFGVSGATVVFTPSAPLAFGTVYRVAIGTAITDAAGNHLAQPTAASFTTIANAAPSADAGPAQDVNVGQAVQLNGVGTDPEGEAVTFKWTQIAGPDVTAGVGYLTGQAPSFTAPATVSALRFELRTRDASGGESLPAIVQVNVMEDRTRAVFVSPSGDDANAGTSRDAPVKTLSMAMSRAAAVGGGADIYAASGSYGESVSLNSGTSIYGGYLSGSWLRDATQYPTTINGTSSATAVAGSGVSDVALDGLVIRTPAAVSGAGQSMYGVRLYQSTNVRLTNDAIVVGDAAPGAGGQAGTPGDSALVGGDGATGVCSLFSPTGGAGGGRGAPGPSKVGLTGGTGGLGGKGGTGTSPGNIGEAGIGSPSTTAGIGGSVSGVGGNGGQGTIGGAGANGVPAGPLGRLDAAGYTAPVAGSGTSGTPGGGGGGAGGGGGGGSGTAGGGGGGGGGGGAGGEGGLGGQGGGGSFGIATIASTAITVANTSITTGKGGDGGSGGRGGAGGRGAAGGMGAAGCNGAGHGGNGGHGGSGGNGGHGAGGSGGPSIGIFEDAASQVTIGAGVIYQIGAAGAGGASDGTGGAAGIAANTQQLP